MANPRIEKLIIKNFGCIGEQAVNVDIDKIVVLVGQNNAGKSTILRAFEVVTEGAKLSQDDFYNRQILPERKPTIEVHSIVDEEGAPGPEWQEAIGPDQIRVKEVWTWAGANVEPERFGFNVALGRWAQNGDREKFPWGPNNVAKAKRPKPHRISTFDEPEKQAKAIVSLFKSLLNDSIRSIKADPDDDQSRFDKIMGELRSLKTDSKAIQRGRIEDIEREANQIIGRVFPGQQLKVTNINDEAPIQIELIGDEFNVEMGGIDETLFPLDKQGSGARRTALWAILKLLADNGYKARSVGGKAKELHEPVGPNASHILLLDEPEVSLHPDAIKSARDVLYSLADNAGWQVMITTHSPFFVDLTKDHTTIVRVEKNRDRNIAATTLYRPDVARLSQEDKENLKLENLFDSHIAEAFFGGRIVVVEGDTEYSAFGYIKDREMAAGNLSYSNLNIIRARGKVTVASMMKVLNHFKSRYYVLHDTDTPRTMSKRLDRQLSTGGRRVYEVIEIDNPAWTNNDKILQQMSENVRVVASLVNFEDVFFGEAINSNKPENCLNHLKASEDAYGLVKQLLDGLLDANVELPEGVVAWGALDELHNLVQARMDGREERQ